MVNKSYIQNFAEICMIPACTQAQMYIMYMCSPLYLTACLSVKWDEKAYEDCGSSLESVMLPLFWILLFPLETSAQQKHWTEAQLTN